MQQPHHHANVKLKLKLLVLVLLIPLVKLKPDLVSDKASLLALRSALGGRTIELWNVTNESPCSWTGIKCDDYGNRVTVIRLPAVSLSGKIPIGIFGNLTKLHTLSLRHNSLSAHLPSDLSASTNLHNLYLQGNTFSGQIPDFVFQFHHLVHLNLASNNFSGVISPSFDNLLRLKTLFLENNCLFGSIPKLNLPKLRLFNVSNNFLNGSVPISFQSFSSACFMGNQLCGSPLEPCSASASNITFSKPLTVDINVNRNKKLLSLRTIAGIVTGSVLGFIFLCIILMFSCRKKKTSSSIIRQEKPIGEEYENVVAATTMVGNGNGSGNRKAEVNANEEANAEKKLVFFGKTVRVFDLENLLRASAEVLGKGTFGTTYKAVLEIGPLVAVKRLKDVTISEREFREKIAAVGAMEHHNLVPLKAYYYSVDEKLLVYDYIPMGSLSALLHGNKAAGGTPLNWEIRTGIACGVAHGIEYLHSQGSNVSHGNIKSSNILLTKSYDAKVSDFGLAQLIGPTSSPNRVVGYHAPEVTDLRKVLQKADVHSFGVLVLELLTGKAPTNEEGVDLPRWVLSVLQKEWTSEVFDLQLLGHQTVEEEMVQLLQLAVDCAAQHPDKRPSMSEVLSRIEELMFLTPILLVHKKIILMIRNMMLTMTSLFSELLISLMRCRKKVAQVSALDLFFFLPKTLTRMLDAILQFLVLVPHATRLAGQDIFVFCIMMKRFMSS